LASSDIFGQGEKGGGVQMWTSALFGAKYSKFFDIYGLLAQQGVGQ